MKAVNNYSVHFYSVLVLLHLHINTMLTRNTTKVYKHVPGLKALAAYHGRQVLDEFGPVDTNLNGGEAIRQRLSYRLRHFVEQFFEELHSHMKPTLEDVLWVKLRYLTEDEALDIEYKRGPYVSLSVMNHLRIDSEGYSRMFVALFDQLVRNGRQGTSMLQTHLKYWIANMTQVLDLSLCVDILTECLLTYPDIQIASILLSSGANLAATMASGKSQLNLMTVAAGTGQYDYVEDLCSTLTRQELCDLVIEKNFEPYDYFGTSSPIAVAAGTNDQRMVRLLSQYADDRTIDAALSNAISRGSLAVIPLLYGLRSPGPNRYDRQTGECPIQDIDTAQLLVNQFGYKLDKELDSSLGNLDVLKYLHSTGSTFDPNFHLPINFMLTTSSDPETLYCTLEMSGIRVWSYDVADAIKTTIEHGNGPFLRALLGLSTQSLSSYQEFLRLAFESNASPGIVQLLIDSGYNVNNSKLTINEHAADASYEEMREKEMRLYHEAYPPL